MSGLNSEILINFTAAETRVAVVENGLVQEVLVERANRRGLVGNIYKGRVARVLPGMQAAFVDIGLSRSGFLHVSDLVGGERREGRLPDIRELLHEGQKIVVQVMKDPIGSKGARLTAQLAISSRFLVLMPQANHIGVSQRIEDEAERARLKEALLEALGEEGQRAGRGYILRTATEGAAVDDLRGDLAFLDGLWRMVEARRAAMTDVGCIYEDLPLALRVLRDMVRPGVERIRVDSRELYERMVEFAQAVNPALAALLEHYPGERPIFYLYNIEEEIDRALARTVPLKSGGYLVIDQTEAMTTVDVNTGAYVGHRNLEETIFKTNLEAATAIARQLRLRNLGGIIIIDFIDMADPEHRRQVLRALEKALERDRAKTAITGVSALGLVEMTRKRTSESLGQMLCEPCPTCGGRGLLKSAETVCHEILREIQREARAFECEKILVLAAPQVVDRLLDEASSLLADLEETLGRPIELRAETLYPQEQYDIIPV
ncbi:MAG: axial filament protein [Porticoccaceae bacterium]|nr:MAG: axial filament protein [Porticoccaceae bacterium]